MNWIKITPETVLQFNVDYLFRSEHAYQAPYCYATGQLTDSIRKIVDVNEGDTLPLDAFTHYCIITEPVE